VAVVCSAGAVTGDDCNKTQVFTYKATDACGNEASDTVTYTWKIDITPPEVECVTNEVTVAGDANCQALLPALEATATDNCDGVLPVVQTPPVGTLITGDSDTVVTMFAIDDCGNSNSCEVIVKVNCTGGLAIAKTVYLGHDSGASCPGSELVQGTHGDAVTYCMTVTNTGTMDLYDVTVTDNLLSPPVSTNLGTLGVGQAFSFHVDRYILSDLTNRATAQGTDPIGGTYEVDDTAVVLQWMKIGGSVFLDVDTDGEYDPEDTNGIAEVTVTLLDANSIVVATTTTAADGSYVFTNLPPGSYTVVETDPLGYFSTGDIVPPNDNRIPVTLVSGTDSTGNDFLDAQIADLTVFKTFLSATEPDAAGDFKATYRIDVINPADSAATYGLTDDPDPDGEVTVNGADVTGLITTSFTGGGPYELADDASIAAHATNTYWLELDLTLSAAVLGGTASVSDCLEEAGEYVAKNGLFNAATITYGAETTTVTVIDCGEIPPYIVPEKTFVSASEPDVDGKFQVTYTVTVKNTGGTAGTYNLVDKPDPDANVTITAASWSGQASGSQSDGGPYPLADDMAIAAGATHSYTLVLSAQLSAAVIGGTASVSDCLEEAGEYVAKNGLFNAATITYGAETTTVTVIDCGEIPPYIVPEKTFVSASEPDVDGKFQVTYTVTVKNTGGTAGTYNLVDKPDPDANVTITAASWSGQASGSQSDGGPYPLADDMAIAAGATHSYTLVLSAQLSAAVIGGTASVSDCLEEAGEYVAKNGLFNAATITYGAETTTVTVIDCGEIPPYIVIDKTFGSASDVDGLGNFVATYTLKVKNTGGSPTFYDLQDIPAFDPNIIIAGGTVTGHSNLTLVGAGPYPLVTDEAIAAGETHTYTLTLNAQLIAEVMEGTAIVRTCGEENGTPQAGEGLFNEMKVTYGDTNQELYADDCGDIPPIPRYTLVKELVSPLGRPAILGEAVVFTLTVENIGEVGLAVVPLVDTYDPALLTYASAMPPADDSTMPGTVIWTNVGPLGTGDSVTVTASFTAVGYGEGTNTVVTAPITETGFPLPPQTSSVPYSVAGAGIGDTVWYDVDGNGILDSGEPGLVGVAVALYDNTANLLAATATDVAGFYSFTNLPPGTYAVVVDPLSLPSYRQTADPDYPGIPVPPGEDDHRTTTPIVLAAGQEYWDADFGYQPIPLLSVIGDIAAFTREGQTIVRWETIESWDTAGYYLERQVDGQWVRISQNLIPYPLFGASPIVFEDGDPGAVVGGTYLYRLVEIEIDGDVLFYGPYELTVNGAGRTYADWAAARFTPEELDDPAISGREADPDGDGLSNWQEFLAGTDPKNADSVLQVTGIARVAEGLELRWDSVAGRTYRIAVADSLLSPYLPLEEAILATDGNGRALLSTDFGDRQMYFRVILLNQ